MTFLQGLIYSMFCFCIVFCQNYQSWDPENRIPHEILRIGFHVHLFLMGMDLIYLKNTYLQTLYACAFFRISLKPCGFHKTRLWSNNHPPKKWVWVDQAEKISIEVGIVSFFCWIEWSVVQKHCFLYMKFDVLSFQGFHLYRSMQRFYAFLDFP